MKLRDLPALSYYKKKKRKKGTEQPAGKAYCKLFWTGTMGHDAHLMLGSTFGSGSVLFPVPVSFPGRRAACGA